MNETAAQALTQLEANPWLSAAIAFLAGLAAGKTVSYERRPGLLLSAVIGAVGLFLAQWAIIHSGLDVHLRQIAEFRILVDLVAAYFGAFIVAAVIHFVKPI